MEFAYGKLRGKKSPRRAIFCLRKGLKRYPFLPEAKKIQAESPVRRANLWFEAPDAPK
jgi:hypothetical protein